MAGATGISSSTVEGVRSQRYVGPGDARTARERIEHHQEALDDERERRSLVSTLVRSFGMPQPIPEIGAIVEALAKAGVFRLRGVLVGTVAYQTYSTMLGTKLPIAMLQTGDVDIAQFRNVSVAVEDQHAAGARRAQAGRRELPRGSDSARRAA